MVTDEWTKREQDILERLRAKAPAAGLTAEEVEMLKQVLDAFRVWRAFGRGARFIVVTLAAIAAAIAAYETIVDRLRQWLVGS